MATKIEWATDSWNPVTGCTPVSAGCDNCYARRMANRLRGCFGYPKDDPFRVTLHSDRLDQPLKWRKPRMIFVCSMGDLFHKHVNLLMLNKIWQVMLRCPQHTFIILTKRPERMFGLHLPPRDNIWLGVSVEDQKTADERIPILLQAPAAVRVVNYEPALGNLNIDESIYKSEQRLPESDGWGIDWVICGGETGPGARPMHPDWPLAVKNQCFEAGVPFFFKQWGEWAKYTQKPSWLGGNLPSGIRTGRIVQLRDDLIEDGHFRKGDVYLERIGKKQAGRLLDGREWNQVPV